VAFAAPRRAAPSSWQRGSSAARSRSPGPPASPAPRRAAPRGYSRSLPTAPRRADAAAPPRRRAAAGRRRRQRRGLGPLGVCRGAKRRGSAFEVAVRRTRHRWEGFAPQRMSQQSAAGPGQARLSEKRFPRACFQMPELREQGDSQSLEQGPRPPPPSGRRRAGPPAGPEGRGNGGQHGGRRGGGMPSPLAPACLHHRRRCGRGAAGPLCAAPSSAPPSAQRPGPCVRACERGARLGPRRPSGARVRSPKPARLVTPARRRRRSSRCR
jgi:hypothetical protein